MSATARAEGGGRQVSLTDLFELSVFARSEEGVERLRDLVIELALSGRLETFDPNEPSAASLVALARPTLANEKRRTLLGLDPKPFPLPANWIWTQTQELGVISPRNEAPDSRRVAFVPMNVVPIDYRRPVTPEVRAWGDIKKGYTHLADGDVAVAKITPCFQNKKSCVLEALPAGMGAGTTELHVLRPVAGAVDPKFLLLFFKSPIFISAGEPRMTGTAGQKRIPVEYFASAPLPLPPLAEQKRIVAKVDQLMALCDELEAKQTKKRDVGDRLTKAALAALTSAETPEEFKVAWTMVAADFEILFDTGEAIRALRQAVIDMVISGTSLNGRSDGLPAVPLKEIVLETRYGTARKCDRDHKLTPVLRIPNVVGGVLDLKDLKYTALPPAELAELALRTGDVLVVRSNGSRDLVGRCCVVHSTAEGYAFAGYLIRIRLRHEVCLPEWFQLAMQSSSVRMAIEGPARTTSGVHNVNTKELLALSIPLPSLKQQTAALHTASSLMRLCDSLEARLRDRDATAGRLADSVVALATSPAA